MASFTSRIALGKDAAGSSTSAAAIGTNRFVRRRSPNSAAPKVVHAHPCGLSRSLVSSISLASLLLVHSFLFAYQTCVYLSGPGRGGAKVTCLCLLAPV